MEKLCVGWGFRASELWFFWWFFKPGVSPVSQQDFYLQSSHYLLPPSSHHLGSFEEVLFFMWYLYTLEFFGSTKKNEIFPLAGKWIALENIILSEVS
jgi:hypothetical protein